MRPVLRVEGTDPVILYNGKEKQLRTEPIYVLDRASGYSDHRVEFGAKTLSSQSSVASSGLISYTKGHGLDSDIAPIGFGHGVSIFTATLRTQQAINGGFAAVIIYSDTNLTEAAGLYNQTEIMVRELPDMPAGQEISLKFKCAVMSGGRSPRYFIQLFDRNGLEIPSNVMAHAWRYYALRDREQLKHILPGYLQQNSGATKGVTPAVMPKPFFPPDIALPKSSVEAVLDISTEGLVTEVNIIGLEPGALHAAITEALEGWLFLPRLEGGNPVAAKVQVPINF